MPGVYSDGPSLDNDLLSSSIEGEGEEDGEGEGEIEDEEELDAGNDG